MKAQPQLIDDGFPVFWEAYPRKVGKVAAKKAWKALDMTPALYECIMAYLEIQTRNVYRHRGKKFIPHPGTWLRARAWEEPEGLEYEKADEIVPPLARVSYHPPAVKHWCSGWLSKGHAAHEFVCMRKDCPQSGYDDATNFCEELLSQYARSE